MEEGEKKVERLAREIKRRESRGVNREVSDVSGGTFAHGCGEARQVIPALRVINIAFSSASRCCND